MNKKNKILLIVLLILIIVFSFQKLHNNRKYVEKQVNLVKIDAEKFSKFEIKKNNESIILEKINNLWKITSPVNDKAKESEINDFISTITQAKYYTLPIVEEENKFATYNVSDSVNSFSLKLFEGNSLVKDLVFGNSNDYNYAYARFEEKVYKLTENNLYKYKTSLTNWRETNIISIDKNMVDKIVVNANKNSYSISTKDSLWNISFAKNSVEKKESPTLTNIFNLLNRIDALDFIDNKFATYEKDFEKPYLSVEVNKKDGLKESFSLIKKDNSYILLKENNKQILYKVNENIYNTFNKTLKDF